MPPSVFWPEDVRVSGFCYGWTTPTLCVAGVIPETSSQEAETTLAALNNRSQWSRLREFCSGDPIILGECTFTRGNRTWHPSLELTGIENYTIIYYHRHTATSLRFYSLETLEPDTEASPSHKARNAAYAASLEHDFTRRHPNSGGMNDVVINQFNAAKTIDTLLQQKPSRQLLPLELSQYLFDIMDVSLYIPSRISSLFRLPRSSAYLKDFSSTSGFLQQLDVRAEQAEFLTHEVTPLRQHDLTSVPVFSARYTNFFNTVWLILNDITIGVAFGSFLCENNIVLARMLNHLIEVFLIDWVCWVLRWLDSWPAGLKLNTELSRFYSHTFSDLVALWGSVLHHGAPYLPAILYAFGILSASGMTTAIALLSDLLALLTVHIYVCYFLSRALYARLLRTGGSLWNLFRGKRFNVLRNRTDAWAYDTDQLLFGTILFTLLAFLFPTVLAYYALFAMMRLGTILLNAGLETQLAFMNHFPLFALMLRAKDPWRLPGSFSSFFCSALVHVIFQAGSTSRSSTHPIRSSPSKCAPFRYLRLWSRLAAHYNPLRLLWYVLRGERLVAIPRYEMRYFDSDQAR
ncbi:N-acetylglucosaminyl transferase component-domain-containing protein [Mycena latifolia]|nr:N-acetylglucosaminyl transferase component-domain-containing protein [Mycena latifolia]